MWDWRATCQTTINYVNNLVVIPATIQRCSMKIAWSQHSLLPQKVLDAGDQWTICSSAAWKIKPLILRINVADTHRFAFIECTKRAQKSFVVPIASDTSRPNLTLVSNTTSTTLHMPRRLEGLWLRHCSYQNLSQMIGRTYHLTRVSINVVANRFLESCKLPYIYFLRC